MDWDRMLPVFASIGIIVLVAILRDYSRSFAAIVAVMPINIPLGMWIVYAGAEDKQAAMVDFNSALFLNIIPTMMFMFIAWQTAKAGWGLIPIIAVGYAAWGIVLAAIFVLRAAL